MYTPCPVLTCIYSYYDTLGKHTFYSVTILIIIKITHTTLYNYMLHIYREFECKIDRLLQLTGDSIENV